METIKSAQTEQEIQIQLSGTELIEHIADSRNYTKLKNVYIDERASTFRELSDISYIVGLYLIRTSWENQICNQSTQQIAHVLGKEHTTSITRALNELEKQGFVKLHKRKEQLENGRFASLPTIIDVSPLYRIINERQKKWAEQFVNQPKCKIASRSLSAPDLDATPFLDDSPKCKIASRLESNNDAPSNDQEIDENQPTEMQNRTPIINNLITESSSDDDCGKNVDDLKNQGKFDTATPATKKLNNQPNRSKALDSKTLDGLSEYLLQAGEALEKHGITEENDYKKWNNSFVARLRKWYDDGIPASCVVAGIDITMSRHKGGKVNSANFFENEVMKAYDNYKRSIIHEKAIKDNTQKSLLRTKELLNGG